MGRALAEIAFTPAVKSAQLRYGSRKLGERLERAGDRQDELTRVELEFIHKRDGFYQATVSENGWPYVQFRGGPPGFLRVLDATTLGFADFRGNVQYLSVGNINADGRIALILVDYFEQRRLKLWGRARVVHSAEDGELLRRLVMPEYPARVERAIVIRVEAYDWNCSQHITPRFTEDQVREAVTPLQEEVAALRARVRTLEASTVAADSLVRLPGS